MTTLLRDNDHTWVTPTLLEVRVLPILGSHGRVGAQLFEGVVSRCEVIAAWC